MGYVLRFVWNTALINGLDFFAVGLLEQSIKVVSFLENNC